MGADVAGGVNLAAGASAGPGGPGANFGAADVDAGSFAFASFARVFRELLGFSARSTPRERKNAVVQLLEGCGTGTERYGRYYKAIMELLELDDEAGAIELHSTDDDRRLRAGPTHLECAMRSFGERAVSTGRITRDAFRRCLTSR